MNPSFSKSPPAAEETAALWAARLDGSELSASDRAELNVWLAAEPAHRSLLSGYCQFSVDLEQPLARLVESGAVQMPPASAPASSQKRSRFKLFTGSAIAAIAAAIMFAVWVAQPQTQFNEIATAVAQRQSITLSDGTKVDLNAHTRLEVVISASERRVRLAAGEAFFEVQKDPARPFIIETPAGSVRVTGTTFNVRSHATSSLEVTVVEGTVQVRTGDDSSSGPPVSLRAGDKLSSGPTGVSVKALSAAAITDTLAWRNGQIVFDGVPLRQALARFSEYHGRPMSVTDEAAGLLVGGRYGLDDPSGFFAALEELFPVQVTSQADGSVRIISREER
ncbi:MAG TPA: FecR domain-containing protein [Opitutus sp.]|nr:FecR domain-containing protein [Opitutus sp.]